MNYCTPITIYEGTKSQKLLSMINEKLRDKERKNIKKYASDKKLHGYYLKFKKAKEVVEKYKTLMKDRKDSLGIQWSQGYGEKGRYTIASCNCRASIEDQVLLQKASDMYGIGKKKEANVIWDNIIKKYKII